MNILIFNESIGYKYAAKLHAASHFIMRSNVAVTDPSQDFQHNIQYLLNTKERRRRNVQQFIRRLPFYKSGSHIVKSIRERISVITSCLNEIAPIKC